MRCTLFLWLLILSLLKVMYHSIHKCVHPSEFKCIPTGKMHVSKHDHNVFPSGVQVSSKMRDAAVQCDFGPCSVSVPNMTDVSTQCHRLHLPVSSSPVLVYSESELSDIDGQPSMDTSHYTFSPESTSLTPKPVSPTSSISESTYVVFESALLMLFLTCRICRSSSVNVKKAITGSFLRITQFCAHCKKTCCLDSQPFIGSIPAGNLQTSAAILY